MLLALQSDGAVSEKSNCNELSNLLPSGDNSPAFGEKFNLLTYWEKYGIFSDFYLNTYLFQFIFKLLKIEIFYNAIEIYRFTSKYRVRQGKTFF